MKLTDKQYAFLKKEFGIDEGKFDSMTQKEKKDVGMDCYLYETDELAGMADDGIDIDHCEYSDDLLSAMQLVDLLV